MEIGRRGTLTRQTRIFRELFARYLRSLGPGFVSGASDADPTTVATMAVVGSTTAYSLSWLVLVIYPMLAGVQMIAAQIGVASKRGLQELVRVRFGRRWGVLLLASVVTVNLITIGADLEAGAAASGLILHIDYRWLTLPLAAVMLGLLILGSYAVVERILKYVVLVLLAYVVSAFLAHPRWDVVAQATLLPHVGLNGDTVQAALAVFGTTLTSYAYVWEAVEEAERKLPVSQLGVARADAGLGMAVAVAVFWFILISTAATLGVHHHQVKTADEAAQALRPIAGPAAGYIFGIGLLASAGIAVPVLAASTAYLTGAEFDFPFGLSKRLGEAREFYAVLTLAMLIAVGIAFAGIPPIKLLFAASIAGGLGTPVSLSFLLLLGRDRAAMAGRPIGLPLQLIGGATLIIVSVISGIFLVQQVILPALHR